jgi:NADPH-dependent glutamate synthase beta subunit-like oxidoreductase
MAKKPDAPPTIWTTGWTDVLETGTWRSFLAVHQTGQAPCRGACPVDGEIPVWVRQLTDGDDHAAWLTLVERNPLPSITGRICHHPCEKRCNRGDHDGAVSISALEQHVGDLAIERGWALPGPDFESDHHVAVVGGGPAGLSFAYQLRRMGCRVKVFDANTELGGLLRYGIPEYRLPRGVVAAEIERILDLGVEAVAEHTVEGLAGLEELEGAYDAVMIAVGAHRTRWADQFPEDDGRVTDAMAFLRSVRSEEPTELGRRVVVVGGGRVAMDVAGSALRLGATTTIVALERRDAMPAPVEAVCEVLDEGATLIDGAMVVDVGNGSGALNLACVEVELDPRASIGVIRPLELAGTGFTIAADTVILAVGQDPELAGWAPGLRASRGALEVDARFRTNRRGVFAAGDAAGAERFVATAIGDGRRAAACVATHLDLPGPIETAPDEQSREVSVDDINTYYFPASTRNRRETIAPENRKADFQEIRRGLEAERAQAEAGRCFSCGTCVQCDNCFYFCPDMAIVRDPSSPRHYRVLDQYCKGCGCCLEECPCGAMGTREEAG